MPQDRMIRGILVPYQLTGGTLSLLAVRPSVCLSVILQFSRLFYAFFCDIDLKLGIRIGIDIIQIKFEFRHARPNFTGVIALCNNLVFQTFLCRLLRYWLEIWYMNWFWLNTNQVRVSSRLTYFYRSYCPLWKFSFPDFSLQSFEILTWNLIYLFVFMLYRSSSTFVAFDIFSLQLLPFAKF